MSSSKRTSPTASPSLSPKPSLRPFGRRKSSDVSSINGDLQRQILDLQAQLNAKTCEADDAKRRARRAEEREAKAKELAKKFWQDEWSGMKDYVGLFDNEQIGVDLREIEERVLSEYRELFGSAREGEMGVRR